MTRPLYHRWPRDLKGADGFVQGLPLCWDAEARQRGVTDDEWWVTIDHGNMPVALLTDCPEHVDCRDCIEWMRA